MNSQDITNLLQDNFAPWVLDLGLTVEAVSPEELTTRMPLTDRLARVGGIVSGQALMAMADTTMVLAACAARGGFHPFATTNMDTQFLRPGKGTAILCRAEIIRAGRALTFVRATMSEESSGKSVATATATLFAA
ncbi:PaaI family thioesterase [Thalassovita aquimarina]|uniref:PaaI family thioesterase n=1 Tax=Thalassovita aquimarina TaxID=2785917 RepID=A0ABS5HU42_9RHOB|nr:PaaI family thioesterase [Thalassovita aquimarina]MBR9652445.1 PaaI family thioesterase [Thalassovita aquimarina]